MNMLPYIILRSIAKQWGVNPDQDYAELRRDLFRLAERQRWNWRPPRAE